MSFASKLFCPCVLAASYSVVWITVWVLSIAVISPVNGITLPMALTQFHLILSQTKSWWDKKELERAEDPNQCRVWLWRRPNYNSLCHLITRLYNSVPKRYCSALLLKVLTYVSASFLFDREVKMTLCMIYCKSLGCDAVLFANWSCTSPLLKSRPKILHESHYFWQKRDSGLLPNLFQGAPHVTHQESSRPMWAHLWILSSRKIKKKPIKCYSVLLLNYRILNEQ